jgi:hypothetical protein
MPLDMAFRMTHTWSILQTKLHVEQWMEYDRYCGAVLTPIAFVI